MSKLHKLIRIKLAAGGFDTDLLQKMAKAKEEQLSVRKQNDLLYEQLLKEQEEKRRAQEAEKRAREAEREDKEVARAARAGNWKIPPSISLYSIAVSVCSYWCLCVAWG